MQLLFVCEHFSNNFSHWFHLDQEQSPQKRFDFESHELHQKIKPLKSTERGGSAIKYSSAFIYYWSISVQNTQHDWHSHEPWFWGLQGHVILDRPKHLYILIHVGTSSLPWLWLILKQLLCKPATINTYWDFSLIDPMTEDFMNATQNHSVIINFSITPEWMYKTPDRVKYPDDPSKRAISIESWYKLLLPYMSLCALMFCIAGIFVGKISRYMCSADIVHDHWLFAHVCTCRCTSFELRKEARFWIKRLFYLSLLVLVTWASTAGKAQHNIEVRWLLATQIIITATAVYERLLTLAALYAYVCSLGGPYQSVMIRQHKH